MERKVKTMEELIDAISNFKDSHPHIQLTKSNDSCNVLQTRRYGSKSPPRGRSQSNFNSQGKGFSSYTNEQSNFRQSKMTCSICKRPNHLAIDCFYKDKQSFERHVSDDNDYSNNRNSNFNSRQSTQFSNENRNENRNEYRNENRNEYRNENRNEYRNENRNQNGQNNNNEKKVKQQGNVQRQNSILQNNGKLFLFPAFVEGVSSFCLRDSGATNICVSSALIDKEKLKTKIRTDKIKLANGSVEKCPVIKIKIYTPWISGITEAAVSKKLFSSSYNW